MTLNLSDIKAKAQLAAKEPWRLIPGDKWCATPIIYSGELEVTEVQEIYRRDKLGERHEDMFLCPGTNENGQFIVSVSPYVVLELIRQHEMMRTALIRIEEIESAWDDVPGRTSSYGDWELRTFARKALEEVSK